MSYIAGKSRLSHYLEETEEDSKLREKNLINEFGDGEDNDELIDEVLKKYETPFKDSLRKAWLRRLSSRSLLIDVDPVCIDICAAYMACVWIPILPCSKRGCSCKI